MKTITVTIFFYNSVYNTICVKYKKKLYLECYFIYFFFESDVIYFPEHNQSIKLVIAYNEIKNTLGKLFLKFCVPFNLFYY